jgi:transposase
MDLQQRSVIRYYVLRKKYNKEIHTKLSLGYDKDPLCQRTVDTWVARFRSGRTSVEDDGRSGRPSRDDFSAAISGHLERNSHASCREIAKNLFVPKITISRVLEEIDSRFFIARWVPHERSTESKTNRADICQEILEILEKHDPQQKNYVITCDTCWIY